MQEQTKPKRKRKLKDISFDHEGAHIALVSKEINSGPANLQEYPLMLKAIDSYSDEILEKASQVTVTLPIEEFLEKFFDVEQDDAEILARALGYTTSMQDKIAAGKEPELPEAEEGEDPEFTNLDEYEKYIQENLASYKIMKSIKDNPNAIAELTGEQYLALLQDQQTIEKAFEAIAKESDLKAIASGSDTQQNASVEKATAKVVKVESLDSVQKDNKGNYMTQEVKTVVADVEKELVEKSVLVDLQKAMKAQEEELNKALALVKQFEQEKKDAITKARKEKLDSAVKNQEQAAVLFKAANLLEDADFEAFVKAVADMQAVADNSDLFKSVGADGTVEQKSVEVDDLNAALIARIEAKSKK